MDKYEPLRQAGTNGANFDLDTEAIIEHLKDWDARYGIELSDVKFDAVLVRFDRLPDDVMSLAKDIYEFCPDTIDQHFGCVAEMLNLAEETGEGMPTEMAELVEGVDLDDEDYGLELLRRSLVKHRTAGLWWD
jgi:hypothetical protein